MVNPRGMGGARSSRIRGAFPRAAWQQMRMENAIGARYPGNGRGGKRSSPGSVVKNDQGAKGRSRSIYSTRSRRTAPGTFCTAAHRTKMRVWLLYTEARNQRDPDKKKGFGLVLQRTSYEGVGCSPFSSATGDRVIRRRLRTTHSSRVDRKLVTR